MNDDRVTEILAWLKRRGTKANREGMARFGIVAQNASGVSVADLRARANVIGRDHDLALSLWATGCYEARMLTAFVDEPARVTPRQMDRWVGDFDNWAICDGLCFHLFDRTPHGWQKVHDWAKRPEEFVRRAAFALLAGLALHDKAAADEPFIDALPLIRSAARDERNFVKKGVSWALRAIGSRNEHLHAKALNVAHQLAASADPTERWVGKDTIRDLSRPLVLRRIAARSRRAG
jgi:3-methyladenine DNA glycosylase AlkD